MARTESLSSLADVAEDQWGLVTKDQAESTGLAWSTISRLTSRGAIERVGRSVYRLRGAPATEHLELRAAWLQLAPAVYAWDRTADEGVVSHRSAAALYGVGHLSADIHEFTLPARRQTRRPDVRLHRARLRAGEWVVLEGLPVTRPSRIAVDLLVSREDPTAVGHVLADSLRSAYDDPGTIVEVMAPLAHRHGLDSGDGTGLLRWLLDLTGDPGRRTWLDEASAISSQSEEPPR